MNAIEGRALANARDKLQILEREYEKLQHDVSEGEYVRDLSARSIRRLMNQLKEEIARCELGLPMQAGGRTRLRDERQVANTRNKLDQLEEQYEALRSDTDEDEHVRKLSRHSLKRLINQLTEEIVRYEAHQPARP